jgi:hypothetical protein
MFRVEVVHVPATDYVLWFARRRTGRAIALGAQGLSVVIPADGAGWVRFGSISTELADAAAPCTSAVPPRPDANSRTLVLTLCAISTQSANRVKT